MLLTDWIGALCHHSAVRDDKVLSDYESIRHYHMSWKYQGDEISEEKAKRLIAAGVKGVEPPYKEISYRAVAEYVNGIVVVRLGRPLDMREAHEPKVNGTHLGYCAVGNFDVQIPTPELYDAIAGAIVADMKLCPNLSASRIEPHRKYSPKTCPGKNFVMDEVVSRVLRLGGRA